ncbi:MAG TPA: nucleotide exchange factor GrpE [Candidatus Acidoferrum sp.]|nr:nucleotide exchange factor GrpE [Candidatus Acidoferrum sp.]
MNENPVPRLSKVPFIIGDALLLAVAAWLAFRANPLDTWHVVLLVTAVAIGAWLAVAPFIIEFRAKTKLTESEQLASAAVQLGNLDSLAHQISNATSEWQHIHQSTTHAVTAADQIAEKMISEARNFGEVLTKINETEKNHLRLEVEKLRRNEGEWLQVIVRILDHINALHQAAARSGQKNLIEQLTQFQNACRDTARRLGLVPLVPPAGAAFDGKQHQLLEGQTAKDGAAIVDLVAPGYTFQGQLLRLPVVVVKEIAPEKDEESDAQLSFDDRAKTPA